MSVLGTTKRSSCSQCIDTWQSSDIALCCIWEDFLLSFQARYLKASRRGESTFHPLSSLMSTRISTTPLPK